MVSKMANSTHGCRIRATEHTDLITEMLLSQGLRIEGVDNNMIGASDIRHVCVIAYLCDLTKKNPILWGHVGSCQELDLLRPGHYD